MNNQRGFITLSPLMWGAIGAGVVMAGLLVALKVQTHRLETVKAEYATFKAQVEAIGLAAAAAAKLKEAQDKLAKGVADAEKKRLTTELAVTAKRLRDANASRSSLPTIAPSAASPGRACFDTTELNAALRGLGEGLNRYDSGVLQLVIEGNQAVIDLDSAKGWGQKRPQ